MATAAAILIVAKNPLCDHNQPRRRRPGKDFDFCRSPGKERIYCVGDLDRKITTSPAMYAPGYSLSHNGVHNLEVCDHGLHYTYTTSNTLQLKCGSRGGHKRVLKLVT